MSLEEYVEAYPYSVLVARKILGGFIRQKTEDMKKTMAMSEQAGGGTMLHVDAMIPADEAEKMDPADLELAETRAIGREFAFPLQKRTGDPGPITIGRSNSCDIVINDYTISKRHAMFLFDPRINRPVFADAGSTNGTSVGRRRLNIGERCALQSGYWVTMGRMLCQFYVASDFYKYLTTVG